MGQVKTVRGDTLHGVTPECNQCKCRDEQKRSPVFQKKINTGDTAELTDDGDD